MGTLPPLAHERPLDTPSLSPLSPNTAAQVVGVSRRTIMRAIKEQLIQAHRDNHGRWLIDRRSLETWAEAQWAPIGQPMGRVQGDAQEVPTPAQPSVEAAVELGELRIEVRHLGERLAGAEAALVTEQEAGRARLAGLEADRDAWREQARRLVEGRRSWLPWRRRGSGAASDAGAA